MRRAASISIFSGVGGLELGCRESSPQRWSCQLDGIMDEGVGRFAHGPGLPTQLHTSESQSLMSPDSEVVLFLCDSRLDSDFRLNPMPLRSRCCKPELLTSTCQWDQSIRTFAPTSQTSMRRVWLNASLAVFLVKCFGLNTIMFVQLSSFHTT